MKKHESNYAFLDSQNIYLSIKAQGWEIDWSRFYIYLKEHYKITNAYLFIGYVEGNSSLYSMLQQAGFICMFKPTLKYKDGTVKGNVDAELVLQTMIEINNFDKAVIVTGDGDFYCLVDYLLKNNKLKTVLIPNRDKYSALLKKFAKKNIAFIDDLKKKVEHKKTKKKTQ